MQPVGLDRRCFVMGSPNYPGQNIRSGGNEKELGRQVAWELPSLPVFPANDAEKGVLSAYLYTCHERCPRDEVASEATSSLNVCFAPDTMVTPLCSFPC